MIPAENLKVELDLNPARAAAPTFAIDFTSDLAGSSRCAEFHVNRGRQHELDRFEGGGGSVVLANTDRALDPTYTSSPYWPNIVPGRRLRARIANGIAQAAATPLTFSGNEITDARRAGALAWTTTQSGGTTDGASTPGGVGIWRAATNLFRRGQCDAVNVDSVAGAGGGGVSIAVDASTPGPFSPQSFKVTTNSAAVNQGIQLYSATGQAAAAGALLASSVWFKGVAGNSYLVTPIWDNADSTTTLGTTTTFVATGSWQLITPTTLAVAASKTGDKLRLVVQLNGTRTEAFWVAHAMLEKGFTYAAPYIATSGGTTATRATASVTAPSSLTNASQGWVAMRLRMGTTPGARSASGSNAPRFWMFGDFFNRCIEIFMNSGYTGKVDMIRSATRDGGTQTQLSSTVSAWSNAGDVVTIVAFWTATQMGISVNGGAFAKATTPATDIPSSTTTVEQIGDQTGGGGTSTMDSAVLWMVQGLGTLTDADAATIAALPNAPVLANGFWNADPSALLWPAASKPSAFWPCVDSGYRIPEDAIVGTVYSEEWPPEWDGPEDAETTVKVTDGLAALAAAPLVGTFPDQLSGARVNAVLDAIGWPAADRVISTGASTIVAATFDATDETTALQHLEDVADTENGMLFVDGWNRIVFLDRHSQLLPPYTASQFTFVDGDYEPSTEFDFSWDLVYNTITATDADDVSVTVQDGTSQDNNWPRPLTRSLLIHTGTSEPTDAASFLLAQHKDPAFRLPQLVFKPSLDVNLMLQALTREIGDRITVVKTPPSGVAISLDFFIESIAHDIVADGDTPDWTTTYGLAPATSRDWWVFDTSRFDIDLKAAY